MPEQVPNKYERYTLHVLKSIIYRILANKKHNSIVTAVICNIFLQCLLHVREKVLYDPVTPKSMCMSAHWTSLNIRTLIIRMF